jgi:hypothetical protein
MCRCEEFYVCNALIFIEDRLSNTQQVNPIVQEVSLR